MQTAFAGLELLEAFWTIFSRNAREIVLVARSFRVVP